MRQVFILSHGNATVESGFSVNEDILVENLHEESLVAQRIVYDPIQSVGSVSSVVVDNALLTYVRGSHARYQTALEQKRKAQSDLDKHTAAKKRAAEQIKELQAKKASLVQTATAEATKIEVEIAELKKTGYAAMRIKFIITR
jgi:hypothetical protein